MATLPRVKLLSTPPKMSSATVTIVRPRSEFDSGINTSNAWAEHLERELSLSDEEKEADEDLSKQNDKGRSARAVYDFVGKPEFQELSVDAGDALVVLKEELADGWSLAQHRGEVGLIPHAYYIFTSDFTAAPDVTIDHWRTQSREASGSSITPTNSPPHNTRGLPLPLQPQTTGEWLSVLPSFRRSLLGGKSLNRFSNFVTTGAEEWVLKGTSAEVDATHHARTHSRTGTDTNSDEEDEDSEVGNRLSRIGLREADRHFVEVGPAWKPKVPPFRVLVHSPSKRSSSITGAYTIYSVTSLFYPPTPDDGPNDTHPPSPTRLTVHRRFSQFVFLHTALASRLPGLALPPLPEKQYAGRFSDAFVEARRGDLQRYLNKLVRHPIARYAEIVTFFLGCESDIDWKRQLPHHLSLPPAGPTFYAHVYHPAFNLDADDATEAIERFEAHTKAVDVGVQNLRSAFVKTRAARIEMSNAERLLSYSLLSLITSKPLASTEAIEEESEDDDDEDDGHNKFGKTRGLMNEDGAWCWREDCTDCLRLTKAMQQTSDTLQTVADSYDDHARRTLLDTHESLKNVAHPSTLYAPIIDTHRSTLSKYKEATETLSADEDVAARCETVLNTTMAEFETYHTQKREDFEHITRELLDDEIAFYEKVLTRLRTARRAFDASPDDSNGPRRPSIYEHELANPRLEAPSLPQPCPHVFDSTPMRPVSAAIQGGVDMLLGGSGLRPGSGRASVFGKFW